MDSKVKHSTIFLEEDVVLVVFVLDLVILTHPRLKAKWHWAAFMLGYLNGIFESKANSKERFSSVFLFWASIAQHHHQWARNLNKTPDSIDTTKKLVNQFHGFFKKNILILMANIQSIFFHVKLINFDFTSYSGMTIF